MIQNRRRNRPGGKGGKADGRPGPSQRMIELGFYDRNGPVVDLSFKLVLASLRVRFRVAFGQILLRCVPSLRSELSWNCLCGLRHQSDTFSCRRTSAFTFRCASARTDASRSVRSLQSCSLATICPSSRQSRQEDGCSPDSRK